MTSPGRRSTAGTADTRRQPSSYQRLASLLRSEIAAGHFGEDEPLPTDLELGSRHGLSRQTVRRAYQELVAEGLVYRVPGRGTFVTNPSFRRPMADVDDLLALSEDTELVLVHPLRGDWDDYAAERLALTGRSLYSVTLRRLHRGETFCVTTAYLPPSSGTLIEDLPSLHTPGDRTATTIIGLLESRGIRLHGADQVISAVAADESICGLLGGNVGDPVLRIERLYHDAAGKAVEFAISYFLPELYSHRLHLGRRHHLHAAMESSG